MPANYVLLERIELATSLAGEVTFTNIPQTGYTDLKLVISANTLYQGGADAYVRFQGGAGTTNYTWKKLQRDGASVVSYGGTGTGQASAWTLKGDVTANTFASTEIYIPNYSVSGIAKSFSGDTVVENNATASYSTLSANLWSVTSAITEITLSVATGFVANSTFSLYGLAAVGTTPAIAPKASGGNITTDGTYWYHTFLSSGYFVPQVGLTCDILQVAGGGAGGYDDRRGGGGGAGGLLGYSNQSLTANTTYVTTVGAGGTGAVNSSSVGGSGNNSQFGSLTASVGGGRGGGAPAGSSSRNGGNGGSGGGGGGGGNGSPVGTGGSATTGQGNIGGNANTQDGEGGGGGAGAAGANASGTNGGAGGVGLSTYSSWGVATGAGENISGTYYFAGGGGGGAVATGGAGGYGGGTAGNATSNALANTGGGTGGGGASGTTGNGGSGIVIVRYKG